MFYVSDKSVFLFMLMLLKILPFIKNVFISFSVASFGVTGMEESKKIKFGGLFLFGIS